jgi:hypothetical protein
MCEVSESGALNTRLLADRSDIMSLCSYRAQYGYPIPGLYRRSSFERAYPGI